MSKALVMLVITLIKVEGVCGWCFLGVFLPAVWT